MESDLSYSSHDLSQGTAYFSCATCVHGSFKSHTFSKFVNPRDDVHSISLKHSSLIHGFNDMISYMWRNNISSPWDKIYPKNGDLGAISHLTVSRLKYIWDVRCETYKMSCVLRLKKWETAPYSQKNLGAGHAQLLISEELCNFRVRHGVGYASKNLLLDLLNIADNCTTLRHTHIRAWDDKLHIPRRYHRIYNEFRTISLDMVICSIYISVKFYLEKVYHLHVSKKN